ncbi:MAG: hypothetical protein U9Q15_02110 [Patescibacteria group bacterium]|nr:hypothetical protein [Patescibacteria group bacterium]
MELEKRPESRVLLVFDTDSPLSSELSQAYISAIEQHNIPATIIEFDPENTRPIWDAVESANPDDVAVLVQTGSFRLDEFRFRLVLYRHGFRVVEHPHLGHNAPDQTETYIDTLTYDMPHFEAVFQQCQNLFNGSKKTVIRSTDGSVLEYSGTMDKVLANTGDFSAAEKK